MWNCGRQPHTKTPRTALAVTLTDSPPSVSLLCGTFITLPPLNLLRAQGADAMVILISQMLIAHLESYVPVVTLFSLELKVCTPSA